MRVFRCDNYQLSAKIADKVRPNGYAVFPATITRAGIFSYRQADGSVVRELRHPDEVFNPESMNSLKNVPLITEKDHLDCLAKGLPVNKVDEFTQLGVVGSDIKRNRADELEADVTVYRPDTLQKIDSGEERELSAGYTVDIINEPGEYRGQKYDQKQTNIIYGHVAAVGRGRAGTAKFRIDSKAAILSTGKMNFQKEDSVGDETKVIKEIPGLNVGKGEHVFRLDSLKVEETPEVLGILAPRRPAGLGNRRARFAKRYVRNDGNRGQGQIKQRVKKGYLYERQARRLRRKTSRRRFSGRSICSNTGRLAEKERRA
jgi:hypothetical protein